MEYQKIIHFIDNNIADGVQPKTLRLETLTTQAKCCTAAELQKPKKIDYKIIQRQLQMRMIKKYIQEDIYLQKKEKDY